VAGDSTLPRGNINIPIQLTPSTKQFQCQSGDQFYNLQANGSPQVLQGLVGGTGPVTQGLFLYLSCVAPLEIVITQVNPAGGTVTQTEFLQGIMIKEVNPLAPITQVTAQGVGQLEAFCAGNV
jgi:hypothetical protein